MVNVIKVRAAVSLLSVVVFAAVAVAQDHLSLRPVFKPGDESRYSISVSVETTVTPKGTDGIGGSSRQELTATVLVRTLSLGENGEVNQEALVEAISFSASNGSVASPSSSKEVAGKKIEFTLTPGGYLSKCTIPESRGYLAVADLIFSLARWRPAGEVAVGGSWEAVGRGHMHSDRLSEIPIGATTVYKLASLTNGSAAIEGAVTLNQTGSSSFNTAGGSIPVSVRAAGKGVANIEVDAITGRVTAGAIESRIEGTLTNIRPTAEGEKIQPREGALVETSRFSIKLVS